MTSAGPAITVIGTALQATTYAALVEHCKALVRRPTTTAIDFTNTQIVTKRRHEPGFHAVTQTFDLFIPDGMPLIWCLNAAGARLRDRVYGPTFMRQCMIETPAPFTHYFLGGSEDCVQRLKEAFLASQPALKILGSRNGYFGPVDEPSIIEEINRLSPDFVWIGLGTPKQQEWIQRNRPLIQRGLLMAVGFAFDVNAGTKKDAPGWMQRSGTTWIYRMLSEPRRLVTRYLKYNSLFLFYLLWDSIRGRRAIHNTTARAENF